MATFAAYMSALWLRHPRKMVLSPIIPIILVMFVLWNKRWAGGLYHHYWQVQLSAAEVDRQGLTDLCAYTIGEPRMWPRASVQEHWYWYMKCKGHEAGLAMAERTGWSAMFFGPWIINLWLSTLDLIFETNWLFPVYYAWSWIRLVAHIVPDSLVGDAFEVADGVGIVGAWQHAILHLLKCPFLWAWIIIKAAARSAMCVATYLNVFNFVAAATGQAIETTIYAIDRTFSVAWLPEYTQFYHEKGVFSYWFLDTMIWRPVFLGMSPLGIFVRLSLMVYVLYRYFGRASRCLDYRFYTRSHAMNGRMSRVIVNFLIFGDVPYLQTHWTWISLPWVFFDKVIVHFLSVYLLGSIINTFMFGFDQWNRRTGRTKALLIYGFVLCGLLAIAATVFLTVHAPELMIPIAGMIVVSIFGAHLLAFCVFILICLYDDFVRILLPMLRRVHELGPMATFNHNGIDEALKIRTIIPEWLVKFIQLCVMLQTLSTIGTIFAFCHIPTSLSIAGFLVYMHIRYTSQGQFLDYTPVTPLGTTFREALAKEVYWFVPFFLISMATKIGHAIFATHEPVKYTELVLVVVSAPIAAATYSFTAWVLLNFTQAFHIVKQVPVWEAFNFTELVCFETMLTGLPGAPVAIARILQRDMPFLALRYWSPICIALLVTAKLFSGHVSMLVVLVSIALYFAFVVVSKPNEARVHPHAPTLDRKSTLAFRCLAIYGVVLVIYSFYNFYFGTTEPISGTNSAGEIGIPTTVVDKLPNLELPWMSIPRIPKLSSFNIPSFKVPENFEIPSIKVPSFGIPGINITSFNMSSIKVPSFKNLSIPKMTITTTYGTLEITEVVVGTWENFPLPPGAVKKISETISSTVVSGGSWLTGPSPPFFFSALALPVFFFLWSRTTTVGVKLQVSVGLIGAACFLTWLGIRTSQSSEVVGAGNIFFYAAGSLLVGASISLLGHLIELYGLAAMNELSVLDLMILRPWTALKAFFTSRRGPVPPNSPVAPRIPPPQVSPRLLPPAAAAPIGFGQRIQAFAAKWWASWQVLAALSFASVVISFYDEITNNEETFLGLGIRTFVVPIFFYAAVFSLYHFGRPTGNLLYGILIAPYNAWHQGQTSSGAAFTNAVQGFHVQMQAPDAAEIDRLRQLFGREPLTPLMKAWRSIKNFGVRCSFAVKKAFTASVLFVLSPFFIAIGWLQGLFGKIVAGFRGLFTRPAATAAATPATGNEFTRTQNNGSGEPPVGQASGSRPGPNNGVGNSQTGTGNGSIHSRHSSVHSNGNEAPAPAGQRHDSDFAIINGVRMGATPATRSGARGVDKCNVPRVRRRSSAAQPGTAGPSS